MKKIFFLVIALLQVNIFAASFNVTNDANQVVAVKVLEKYSCFYIYMGLGVKFAPTFKEPYGANSQRAIKIEIKVGSENIRRFVHLIDKYGHCNFRVTNDGVYVSEVINQVEQAAVLYGFEG